MSRRSRIRAAVPTYDNPQGDDLLAAIELASAHSVLDDARDGLVDVSAGQIRRALVTTGDIDPPTPLSRAEHALAKAERAVHALMRAEQ